MWLSEPLVDFQICVAKGMIIIICFRLQARIIQKEMCATNMVKLINSQCQYATCSWKLQSGWLARGKKTRVT